MHTHYVLLLASVIYCYNCLLDEKPSLKNEIIAHIVSKFIKFNMMFHFDKNNKIRVDTIIKNADIQGAMMLQNYELPVHCRPYGYQFLHVILLKNYTEFGKFTNTSNFSLTFVDVLFFVVDINSDKTNNSVREYWPSHGLDKAGSMFVLNLDNLVLFSVCFYCGEDEGLLKKIAKLSNDKTNDYNMSVSLLDIHKNRFTNFNEHQFSVAYALYLPFFGARLSSTISDDNTTVNYEIEGSEAALIFTLQEKLNMTFYVEEFNDTEDNWNKLVDSVENGSFDFAMGGITLTNKRMEIVDFTNSIQNEAYTVLYYIHEDLWMAWLNVVFPFDMLVWFILLLIILVISVLFGIAIKVTNIGIEASLLLFFQRGLRLFVEQPVPKITSKIKSRITTLILMSLWLMVALIMTNCYRSKLTSFLITSRAEEFDSIDQLVERDYSYFVNSGDSYVIREFLENSGDNKFLKTLERSRNDTEFCESILQTSLGKVAVIDEETNFQYGIDKYCPEVTSSTWYPRLRLMRTALYPSTHAWPVRKNSPYRASVNRVIALLHSGGLFQYWGGQYDKIASSVRKSQQRLAGHDLRPFTLRNMVGPATVWALGIIGAFIVFAVEMIR